MKTIEKHLARPVAWQKRKNEALIGRQGVAFRAAIYRNFPMKATPGLCQPGKKVEQPVQYVV
jgi:ABC-type antimicrobial peptide transport system ATPase subunit